MQFPMLPLDSSALDQLSEPASGKTNRECILQPLYAVKEYVSAATTQLTFFTDTDQNQGHLTNMRQAGMIPNGKSFLPYILTLDILGFPPADNTQAADEYTLRHGNGATGIPYAQLTYNSKAYPDSGGHPLFVIGPSSRVQGMTTRTATEWAQEGAPGLNLGALPDGTPAVAFEGGTSFSWQLSWPDAVTLGAGNVYLFLCMWGVYYRNIQ